MRLFTQILSFLLLLVLLTAEDCAGPSESYKAEMKERQISEMYQSIENDFINDELSMKSLDAFEKRAIQKLKDISDYINIYADTSLSVQFRIQAGQMIKESFPENTYVQKFFNSFELQEDTVNGFLYHTGNLQTFRTAIDSVVISDRLTLKSVSNYTGTIQFTQKTVLINSTDTIVSNSFRCRLNIMAIKTRKNFGDKTEDVWEVYLGEIQL
jgi:hypothetical protein